MAVFGAQKLSEDGIGHLSATMNKFDVWNETPNGNDTRDAESSSNSSGVCDKLLEDEASSAELSLIEEYKLIKKLTMNADWIDSPVNRNDHKCKKQRRKRGTSLEREISQLILQTATAGGLDAHFAVGTMSDQPSEGTACVEYILRDLKQPDEEAHIEGEHTKDTTRAVSTESADIEEAEAQQQVKPGKKAYIDSPLELAIYCNDEEGQSIVAAVDPPTIEHADVPDPPLLSEDDNAPPETSFRPVDSFDTLSWEDEKAMTPVPEDVSPPESRPGSPMPQSMSITSPSQWAVAKDPPASSETSKLVESSRYVPKLKIGSPKPIRKMVPKLESKIRSNILIKSETKKSTNDNVVFKTKFEDWTPFAASSFKFDDTVVDPVEFHDFDPIDENGFLVTPSQSTKKIPKLIRPVTPPRRKLSDPRSWRRDVTPPSSLGGKRSSKLKSIQPRHPNSPDSVFDYPTGTLSSTTSSARSDPPATRHLQLPQRHEATRIAI